MLKKLVLSEDFFLPRRPLRQAAKQFQDKNFSKKKKKIIRFI